VPLRLRRIEPVHIFEFLRPYCRRKGVNAAGGTLETRDKALSTIFNNDLRGYYFARRLHSCVLRHGIAAKPAIERAAWLVTADPEFARIGKTLFLSVLPRHHASATSDLAASNGHLDGKSVRALHSAFLTIQP